ncbi:Tad domain-containing protein [bacterium]|nr:Tad domain-containing protein [bacterium]
MLSPPANRQSALGNRQSPEAGQALVFGALTLFMLACFVIFVADLGLVTSARLDVQIAADECAYSGALYEANVCSAVAYMNEAMAYMYYDALRYAVDNTIHGVMAGLKRHGPEYPSDKLVYEDADAEPAPYSSGVIANYDRVYQQARDNIPDIERTLNHFARWEWGMALAAAELVKMEIHRTARKHAIEAVALYPDVDFFPGNGVQFDLHIKKLMEGGEHVGWRIYTDDPPFYVEARKLGPFHWLITDTARNEYEIQRIGDDIYRIQTATQDITVHKISDTHVRMVMVQEKDGKTETTNIDAINLPGLGWAVSMSDSEQAVEYKPFKDGGYTISVTDKQSGTTQTTGIRRNPQTGKIQEYVGGAWVDVPGQHDEVTVGGVTVGVQIDDRIHLGPDTWFRVPNELHLGNVTYNIPNVFQLPNFWVTLLPDSARIDAFINIPVPGGSRRLRFTIDETDFERMHIYGLLGRNYWVPDSADCKWYTNRDGDERDRLCRDCQLEDGECTTPSGEETDWTYQYRLGKPYFIKENLARFAHHAICDRDPFAKANDFAYPPWTDWYDIAQGEPRGHDYYQTRPNWGDQRLANYDTDGDGENDAVRIYARNTGALNRDDSRDFDPHYRKVKPWVNAITKFAPPVRLSEDFFFFGLSVGCWRSRPKGQTAPSRFFQNPRWGVVGMASARAGFLELTDEHGRRVEPHYRFTWDYPGEVEAFVNSGYENLYEPVWTAHLWPMTDAIRSEHIRAYVDNQTGLSYLLRGLLHAHWYVPRSPDQLGEEPQLREDVPFNFLRHLPINVDHPDIGEVIEH